MASVQKQSQFAFWFVARAFLTLGTVTPSFAQEPRSTQPIRNYEFDQTIPRDVLENYLDRSVTMAYFLVTGKTEGNREYQYRDDDLRLIQNIGTKFIGRAIYRWNGEARLNDASFWNDAKAAFRQVVGNAIACRIS